jgi:ABC-type uncharacterized transport system substrate-binding protein
MQRREFISLLGGAAVAWPRATAALDNRKLYRIGYLGAEAAYRGRHGLVSEMEKLGYVEGKDFIIEWRFADLKHERLLGLALELVELNVDVIVAATGRAVKEAQHATRDIPIVMAVNDDPVRMGLVTSLARPGGNTTGLSAANNETLPKQLELLNFVVPNLSRIGYLVNPISADPENPYLSNIPLSLDAAAQALKLTIQRAVVLDPSDLERAFVAMENGHVQAAVIAGGPLLNPLQRRVAELALAYKLRSIAQRREYAEVGLLMSYGESRSEFWRRTAYFVDKILKGAEPAHLPVELPTRFNLVINLRSAKTLGITIPAQLLTTADDLLE